MRHTKTHTHTQIGNLFAYFRYVHICMYIVCEHISIIGEWKDGGRWYCVHVIVFQVWHCICIWYRYAYYMRLSCGFPISKSDPFRQDRQGASGPVARSTLIWFTYRSFSRSLELPWFRTVESINYLSIFVSCYLIDGLRGLVFTIWLLMVIDWLVSIFAIRY